MRAINISNDRNRNAQVGFEQNAQSSGITMTRTDREPYNNVRLLKSTMATDFTQLTKAYEVKLIYRLVSSDPEIDMERVGLFLKKVRKVFITSDGKMAYKVSRKQALYTPEGELKDVRKFQTPEANINIDNPLRWTGKLIPKEKAIRMFAFTRSYQLKHINGLTFDFLYEMAKKLDEGNSLMLLGGGSKGTGPIILSTGGIPYRAFIEGRVDGDKYCLIMHLTNLELKPIL